MKTPILALVILLAACGYDQSYVDKTLSAMASPVIVVAKDDVGLFEGMKSITLTDSSGQIVTIRCDCLSSLNVGDTLK